MKINAIWVGLLGSFLLLSGCKSEFEQIRTSGDPNLLYQKATAYYEAGDFLKAQTLYELVISSFRGKQEAEEIAFRYAYTYYNLEQFLLASYYFNSFAQTYGASRFREEAEFMSAYSNYRLSPIYRLDQTTTIKAIEALQEFVNQYPNSERAAECNQLIDGMRAKLEVKALESAKLYMDLQQYQAAVVSFDNLLKDFPETTSAETVRYLIVRCDFLLAQNSFVERQMERYQEALARANEFLERYSGSGYRREVEQMVADSEKRLKQLEDVRYQNTSTRSGS